MALGTVPTNNISALKGSDLTIPFVVGADLSADITGWTITFTYKSTDIAPALTITIAGAVPRTGPWTHSLASSRTPSSPRARFAPPSAPA